MIMSLGETAVGVLGGGAWGTTLAELVARAGHRPLLWLRDEAIREEIRSQRTNRKFTGDVPLSPRIEPTGDIAEVAGECEVIFVAVPLKGLREVAFRLGEHLRGDRVLVSCAKGLEAGTQRRPTEILREETCAKKVGVLSGPNLAAEIVRGEPCATVVASHYREVRARAWDAIMGPTFRVFESDDVVGVEIAGALKNVIAIAAGMATGLGFGANSKAALITRGLAEIARYGCRFGANPLTFAGLAGIGDMVATCWSPLSRNHQVGVRLARGEKLETILCTMVQTAEGVNTTRVIAKHAEAIGLTMPITSGVYRILFEGATPLDELQRLMARSARPEVEMAAAVALHP